MFSELYLNFEIDMIEYFIDTLNKLKTLSFNVSNMPHILQCSSSQLSQGQQEEAKNVVRIVDYIARMAVRQLAVWLVQKHDVMIHSTN